MTVAPMTGAEIAAFRKSKKLTRAGLAKALGAPTSHVQGWETGKQKPPAMLRLACAAIDADLPPWSAGMRGVEIEIEAQAHALPALVAQIVSLRRDGYEPASLVLPSSRWKDLVRSAGGTALEDLVEDRPGRRELAGIEIEFGPNGETPAFICQRAG